MKSQHFITILVAFFALNITAQVQTETVSIGAGYTDQVWYNLSDGIIESAPKNDWDIAFDASAFGSSILINSIIETELYIYPGSTADFETLDISDIGSWEQAYNSVSSWDYGAFSQYQEGLDVGWGIYNTMTQVITGDSLYVVKLSSGEYQKLWVQTLSSGTYTFRHATIDNSTDMTHSIAKADYTGKNFAYFDFETMSGLDREPASADWDLLFTQHTAFIPIPYTVSGVLSNRGVTVAQADGVFDTDTYEDFTAHSFVEDINEIGYDWKSFTGMGYAMEEERVYFVERANGQIWKLVFIDFEGSATGNYVFTKEQVGVTGLDDLEASSPFMQVYPNPTNTDQVNIVYNNSFSEVATAQIIDLSGRIISQQALSGSGLSTEIIDLNGVSRGIYLVRLNIGNSNVTQRLSVR